MDLGLRDKTALVLAGAGGLGGAISERLALEGASVIVADIDLNGADDVAERINNEGGIASAVKLDLGESGAGRSLIESLLDKDVNVDVLVNITGGPAPGPIAGQDPETWTKAFQSMVLSIVEVADAILPSMQEAGWGRIITSMSSGVVAPIANLGISNSLRQVLVGWSKTLSTEVAGSGVTVNTIIPGRIETSRIRFLDEKRAEALGLSLEEVQEESCKAIPIGRYGTPDEYAAAVAFLASVHASYITGTSIHVDGGYIKSV